MIRPPARQSSGLFLNIEVYVNISWPATQTKTEYETNGEREGRGGGLENTIIFDIDKSGERGGEKRRREEVPCDAGNVNESLYTIVYIILYLLSLYCIHYH